VSCATRRFTVPRGKAKFKAKTPDSDLWRSDPVGAVREIAERNNAKYVEGSLIFAPGGRAAEALFETVEPDEDSPASQLFRLAEDLDAWEFHLYVDPERWKYREQGSEQS
jgi:putative intracellular protease/amidase